MKAFKFAAILIAFVSLAYSSIAQTRIRTTQIVGQGSALNISGTVGSPIDSLQVTDSIAYLVPLQHDRVLFPYYSWEWTKIGTGSATITLQFLQSNDGVGYFPVKAGLAQTTYTKTYTTVAASTSYEVDMFKDTASVSGRYLKIYYITSSTVSVKGKIHGLIRANAQ